MDLNIYKTVLCVLNKIKKAIEINFYFFMATQEKATFSSLGLVEVLCDTVSKLGYTEPTPIQRQAIPYALQGRDIIGLAQTGSGKTAAFVLPILQALLVNPRPLFACILSPTRELAIQIAEQCEALGKGIDVRVVSLVGGIDMMSQSIALVRGRPHIIVATPGRLVDHLENTKGFQLAPTLEYLVLDEADRLLDMDFGVEIDKILNFLSTSTHERRTMLFSATMTTQVAKLQKASLKDPVKVQANQRSTTVDTLCQYYLFIPAKNKDTFLTFLLTDQDQGGLGGSRRAVIIFTDTCHQTQRLAYLLHQLSFEPVMIHGKMTQEKRLAALSQFKTGKNSILIATDVASRGLDIPSVDIVINYDIPMHSKDYIHRVGRTARAGRSGKSITLVTQYDIELYQRIEQVIGKTLPEYPLSDKSAVMRLHERVLEAQRFASIQLKDEKEKKSVPEPSKKKQKDNGNKKAKISG